MIIVGELINASRPPIREIIENRDAEAVIKVARDQREHRADYIDLNAGLFIGQEADCLKWLVTTVQSAVDAPCCIDSPDPKAIEAALTVHKGPAMINSISMEKSRYDKLLPLISGSGSRVVALCMSDEGMPKTADERLLIADRLVNGLVRSNVSIEDIYLDPLVQPISTNTRFGIEFLKSVERIRNAFEGVHLMCGLSNVSYGLPKRQFVNQIFIVMAISKGLDGAIVNPLDRRLMASIIAAEALVGEDESCMRYLKAYRTGQMDLL
jgi:5-methyltetrahydrofolate corrinoid/iron sulfur protein methyltransferase